MATVVEGVCLQSDKPSGWRAPAQGSVMVGGFLSIMQAGDRKLHHTPFML